ncbi:hypothetical protein GCM10011575_45480 [Microlunatus endophyticus]|uniref:Uncharacterized protein n=1 Tax=Microlunatus endophyticus TaxID=1716077 RepID=A0A917W9S0_9ACTN|nr:hypothetical protein [Microlunatus endophyticus]GGL82160.1 hypothetical protein GCM10011575_45480 [Microlunatus endophyticus]
MGLFSGLRRGLDRSVRSRWHASARAAGLEPGNLLGWEPTADGGYCVASVGLLSLAGTTATDWSHVGWHRIERGGYDKDTTTLHWQLYADGSADPEVGEVRLQEPGRLPDIFRDRVAASIAVEHFIALEGSRKVRNVDPGVIISGRRDLSRADAPIAWRASLPRGLDWDLPGLRDLADTSIIRLRSEYDPDH